MAKKCWICYDVRAECDESEAAVLEASTEQPMFCEWPDDSVIFEYDIDETKKPPELINGRRIGTYADLTNGRIKWNRFAG